MCKHSGEFIDHLLLHCCVALDIWSCVLALFELSQVMPKSVVESCCNVGKVSFSGISTIEQLRCSKLCPYASCGIYGLRGTSGSLMEERPYVLKAYFAHFVWLDACLRRCPFHVFCWFFLLPLFFICILWSCTHHFMYLPTSFSNKTFTYQKMRWSVIISLSYYHPRLVIWSRHFYLLYYFIVWLDAWLRQRPFHAFCWCLLLPLYVICILWRGFVHIVLCVIPFSFSNQTCNYERWLIIINCHIIIQGWWLEVGMSLLAL